MKMRKMEEAMPDLVATKPEPVVDDDGFELVQPKGKKKTLVLIKHVY